MRYIAQTRSTQSFRGVRVIWITIPDAVGPGQPSLAEALAKVNYPELLILGELAAALDPIEALFPSGTV